MASKIRELKDTIVQQNELVKTLREDKRLVRESITNLYSTAAKYRPDFVAGMTGVEDSEMPELKHEDLTKAGSADIVKKMMAVFGVVVASLEANRSEVTAIYKELDQEIDEAMAGWRQIQAQEKHEQKAEYFRGTAVTDAAKKRPETPEVVPMDRDHHIGPTLPPTPPETAGKKEARPTAIKTDKQKSGTTTLDKMLSPTTVPKAKGNGTK